MNRVKSKEVKILAWLIGVFILFFFLPIETLRFQNA